MTSEGLAGWRMNVRTGKFSFSSVSKKQLIAGKMVRNCVVA